MSNSLFQDLKTSGHHDVRRHLETMSQVRACRALVRGMGVESQFERPSDVANSHNVIEKKLDQPGSSMLRYDKNALDPPVVPAAEVAPLRYHRDTPDNLTGRLGYPVPGDGQLTKRPSHATSHVLVIDFETLRFQRLADRERHNRLDVGGCSVAKKVVGRQENRCFGVRCNASQAATDNEGGNGSPSAAGSSKAPARRICGMLKWRLSAPSNPQ